uniref:Ecdysteroid-phosphate phosphatase n=1 Tax=Strigamia maritima TaxID=126957 RepID=T1ITI2_STRMM
MAALPPRKTTTPTKSSKPQSSPLNILLQMGFPKHRAEKALAATGERGVQLASDWLLAHVNDATLDQNTPREYILYACPTGPILDALQTMWNKSLMQSGRNGAHNYLPHVTLCSFFKAPDGSVNYLTKALSEVVDKFREELSQPIKLSHYTSANFIGLFVAEDNSEILKKLAVHYVKEVANYISAEFDCVEAFSTCFPWGSAASYVGSYRSLSRKQVSSIEPYMKSLHITLAYQFPGDQYPILDELSRKIDCSTEALWELRLYSRDNRITGKEVHKVLYSHIPAESDELELLIGDYVYVDGDQLNNTTDGWVEGTSWLTGLTGYLPKTYIEKTAESDAWTLHKSVPLSKKIDIPIPRSENLMSSKSLANATVNDLSDETVPPQTARARKASMPNESAYENVEAMYAKVNKPKKEEPTSAPNRKLIISRHAERVDFTFGSWIPFCFDAGGVYSQKDLNMPKSVPLRRGGPQDFFKDCPLTQVGLFQGKLVGIYEMLLCLLSEHDQELSRLIKRDNDGSVLNELVYKFITLLSNVKAPISGPIIKAKASIIAEELGFEDFKASNGWFDKFKVRFHLSFNAFSGEADFFPPNTTAKLQPLDAGIIRSFKSKFCELLLIEMVAAVESSTNPTEINAINWASEAWNGVTVSTIQNCFNHVGFELNNLIPEDGDNPLLLSYVNFDDKLSADEYVTVDLDSNTETVSDDADDAFELVLQETREFKQKLFPLKEIEKSDDDDDVEIFPQLTLLEAKRAVEILKCFALCREVAPFIASVHRTNSFISRMLVDEKIESQTIISADGTKGFCPVYGEALKENSITVQHVYCSPSLRCVQTCANILLGMNQEKTPMCIEPGLFEWLAWYQDSMPEWMSAQEFKDYGFNIELNYRPYITAEELYDRRESSEQYYMRSYYVAQSIIKSTADDATLDTCTRQLCRREPRGAIELAKLVHKVPYCSVAIAEETAPNFWSLTPTPFPPVTHSSNSRFDWKS